MHLLELLPMPIHSSWICENRFIQSHSPSPTAHLTYSHVCVCRWI